MNGKKTLTPEEAKLRMAGLCSRSEQCEADIRQKLYRLGLTPAEVQGVVEELLEGRFIDNGRFARSFARDKCRFAGWGRNKIRLALGAKRLSASQIEEGIDAIGEEEYNESLRRAAAAKARQLGFPGDSSRENGMKLFRHLLSRGFEPSEASAAIRELREDKGRGQ